MVVNVWFHSAVGQIVTVACAVEKERFGVIDPVREGVDLLVGVVVVVGADAAKGRIWRVRKTGGECLTAADGELNDSMHACVRDDDVAQRIESHASRATHRCCLDDRCTIASAWYPTHHSSISRVHDVEKIGCLIIDDGDG